MLEHSFGTALTYHLPESYWAPITTLVITQSSFGSTLAVSWQRFIATAHGAVVGGFVATYFGPDMLVFVQASLCWGYPAQHSEPIVARIDSAESRWRSLLLPRVGSGGLVAFQRFAEVSIGIAVRLVMTVVWPESSVGKAR